MVRADLARSRRTLAALRLPVLRSCVLGLSALGLFGPASCGGEATPPRPPVVLVVLDAFHARHAQHLGYPRETTARLDALAADGITFERAFAPAPFTLASIPSLLTGRRPDRHGVFANTRSLSKSEVTIAEHLRDQGYRTFGAVSNLNGSSVYGSEQGFEEYVELFRGGEGDRSVRVPRADEFVPHLERWCDGLTDGESPFFYLHLFEPHEPYDPPLEFRRRFLDPNYTGEFKDGVTMEVTQRHIEEHGRVQYTGKGDVDAVLALYDANIAWVDSVLGRLIDVLRERDLYEGALVVVTSDHGEAFWQHGRQGHGGYLYDEELHVPLVVKLPGADRPRGARVDRLASILDVFPSLCAWLDLPVARPLDELDGRHLGALLDLPDHHPDERELLLMSYRPKFLAALRTAKSKTIVDYDEESGEIVATEHYDLSTNPHEITRQSDPAAVMAGVHTERLRTYIADVRALERLDGDVVLTEEERTALEALGYTDNSE